jgi:hypothetical protein
MNSRMKAKPDSAPQRFKARIAINGDERDPQAIWDRMVGLFANQFASSFATVEIVRTTLQDSDGHSGRKSSDHERRPESDRSAVADAQGSASVKALSEELLHGAIQEMLDSQSCEADRRKLESGIDPDSPLLASSTEQHELMKRAKEFLEAKRREGYRFSFRPANSRQQSGRNEPDE